jgi:hypothetical protein
MERDVVLADAASVPLPVSAVDAVPGPAFAFSDAAAAASVRVTGGLGPLPFDLGHRARRLLSEQERAISRLAARQGEVARHLAALRTIPSAADTATPAYLDASS